MQELSPQAQVKSLFQRCLDLCGIARFQECLPLLDQAIILNGTDYQLYSFRGDVHVDLAEYAGAIEDYQQAIALNPESVYDLINLGVAHEKLRQAPQALEAYDAALLLKPDYPIAHYNRGCALELLKRLPEAYEAYSEAIREWPDFAGAYLNRGHVRALLGRLQEARADYDLAYTYGSEEIQIAWTIRWLHFGSRPLDVQELEHLQHIADLYPAEQHCVSFVCLAIIAFHHKEIPTALAHLQQAAQMEPDQWDPPFWSGLVLAWSGEMDEAYQEIEDALEKGLPPLFLKPLYWLEKECPLFFQQYASPLLQRWGIPPTEIQ